jgi:hypothetical protein
MPKMEYTMPLMTEKRAYTLPWKASCWRAVPVLTVSHFRSESSDHRPLTRVKMGYSAEGLTGIFRVNDRFVRSVRTGYQEAVFKDSCVEFFVQPLEGKGYFNFEFNCGGAMLASYITDPARTTSGFKAWKPLRFEDCRRVSIRHTLPPVVDPEKDTPIIWHLAFFIPFSLLETYAGSLPRGPGTTWRANFYKCGDETSHPHWASWSPVDGVNFHLPRCFGRIGFGT